MESKKEIFFTQEDFEKLNKYANKHGRTNDFVKIEKAVIKRQNAAEIFGFAYYVDMSDKSALEQAIIDTHDSKHIYKYASFIKDANIKKLQDAIIEAGSPHFM